ncbi:MAG TPA: hypothetical protein VE964_08770 [Myxococcales bacterium]|nr:hypothetical protein [Myxococcales bacterium]
MLQDPSGILGRVPELETLTGEPSVRKAIESGDPFKVYRALFWARLLGRLSSQRETLGNLLRNRRLFAKPIGGTPFLGTFNSIGATLLGEAEPDQDGTHVATHAVVVFYVVPLLPLGAYVVRKEESGVFKSSWRIFARVPLGPVAWAWNRLVPLGVAASVSLVAFGAVRAARYGDVRVVNAFDVPVQVTIGDQTATVPAVGDAVVKTKVGKYQARAMTADGIEVDAIDLDVTSGKRVLAWNLAGAMPIALIDVVYHSRGKGRPANDPDPEPHAIYCGQRVIQVRAVDYAFRPPEESLKVATSSDRLVKSRVDYERGVKNASSGCFNYLVRKGRTGEAAGFLETVARIAKWDPDATAVAVYARRSNSGAQATRLAKEARDARPNEIDLHRLYQDTAKEAGTERELLDEYRSRAEAEPGSADAQYLYARLLRGPKNRARFDELAARFPDHVYSLRAAFYARFEAHDWKAAHEAWERLRARSADAATELADQEIRALVAMGKFANALKLASGTFEKGSPWVRKTMAQRFARIAAVGGLGASDVLIARIEADARLRPGEKLWLLRQQSGLEVPKEIDAPGLALARALGQDPAAAVRLAGSASEDDLAALDRGAWALLFCEAARTGNAEAERSLVQLAGGRSSWGENQEMRKLARLELEISSDIDLDPELLAAALLVRSRNPSLAAPERKTLVDEARRLDVLRGPVTTAIPAWRI